MVIVMFQQYHNGDEWCVVNAQVFTIEEAMEIWAKEDQGIEQVLLEYKAEDEPFFLRKADWGAKDVRQFEERCDAHYRLLIDTVNELASP